MQITVIVASTYLSLLCHTLCLVTKLSYFLGCMICLGKSNYFRFNNPREAKRIKESNPGNRFSIVPDQYYPGEHSVGWSGVYVWVEGGGGGGGWGEVGAFFWDVTFFLTSW